MPILTIKRETDVVALAAFILALGAVTYQLTAYFRGARARLFPPEQILIHGEEYPNGHTFVRFAARMAYINSGDLGYNAIIRHESLSVQIGQKEYEQKWQYFIHSDSSADGKTLYLGSQEEAVPTPISGGDAKTHETYFAPWPIDCKSTVRADCNPDANYLDWDTFLKSIKLGDVLTFQLTADIDEGKIEIVNCTVDVTHGVIEQLNTTRNKWGTPACREASSLP
jgi:hypothetical protein